MSYLIGEVRTEQATEHAQLSPFFIVSVRGCSQNTHVLFLYKVLSNKADVLISIYLTLSSFSVGCESRTLAVE